MKFSEMTYTRPDPAASKQRLSALTEELKSAKSYEEARRVFLSQQELMSHISTAATLASIRHSIDTRDKFYDGEEKFWNNFNPELEEYNQAWTAAMLESPFRADFEKEYGDLMFVNAEIALKTFSPAIIPELQQENDLTQEYEKLLASAQIPFEGKVYTLSQLSPFKTCADDEKRLAAWKAEGQWYKDNQAKFDELYDKLVHLRDAMGKKLGYEGYTTLGYYRMGRNCYTKDDVEKFREAVVKYLVPVADKVYREQARRLGKQYPMSFADNALEFRSGNPRPAGTPDDILAQGMKFYSELSPETKEFFETMLRDELLDVLSTEGKQAGGYCTSIMDYQVPFIFANFNGTQHDVEVVTHEAGHAFEAWTNRKRIPIDYIWPSMEACEVHSMSMEFFAEPWADGFFGSDAKKFLYSHLSGALTFIPYGTMVDHFQHIVYEKPEMTPAERHAAWKELLGVYMPWMKLDGEIPFYSEGMGWQRQHHIYSSPFYYIDYCLAQTVALEFWAMIRKDVGNAWQHYCTSIMDYQVPFIFANFNGTQHDVEVVTHEAGHAFEAWTNRKRIPIDYIWPSMEACEVHSMSMEFFAEPWADGFFGSDAKKFLYSHLSGALTFIPYGTMVDHFQHIVYEKPEMTPAERHAAWKELLGVYMPWMKLDGEIPFYSEGMGWQRQHHIYSSPFYYIDYCLAQTVALEFWAMIRKDVGNAWQHYMAYTVQGGSRTFTDLLKNAGLESPFDEACLRGVCAEAEKALADFDLTGIE